MSALDNQPTNPSFLSPLGFKLQIKRTPSINYFVQSVELPSVSISDINVDTPFTRIPVPSTRLTFGNLRVTFKVDEDMTNYLEIYNWMLGMGLADNFEQYRALSNKSTTSGEGLYSDIQLIVMSSAMQPIKEINFVDCFPVDISSLSFDSTSADVSYLTATVTFANRRFTVKTL
jgi:hypothetical protein